MPADGNTSGMGEGYPAPPETQGWNFAGFVPYGIFGFVNGSTLWGVLGLVGQFIGILGLVYAIYIGIKGKEIAWRSRRFDSLAQFDETMRIWNIWGIVFVVLAVVGIVVYFVFFFTIFFGAMMSGFQ